MKEASERALDATAKVCRLTGSDLHHATATELVAEEEGRDGTSEATELVDGGVGSLKELGLGLALDGGVAGREGVHELGAGDEARHHSLVDAMGQLPSRRRLAHAFATHLVVSEEKETLQRKREVV